MWSKTRLVEPIKWMPTHGARVRVGDDGLTFSDSDGLDWHLLRWTDPRLDGARVKLTFVARQGGRHVVQ
jgi:hypothetical protein